MVVYTCDLSTEEMEAGDSGTWGYLQLHNMFETNLQKTLFQKKKNVGGVNSKVHQVRFNKFVI